MKRKLNIFALLVSAVMLLWSCSPDDPGLGSQDLESGDLVEGIAYSITHDSDNPNIVYLTNLLGNQYTPLWEHPQGRSQEQVVTLKMPFAGTYSVTFGVETRGGIVYGEPTTFTVDDFCADFVNDELWTYLSGGVGNSKKWVADIDENGISRYFDGPITFHNSDVTWDNVNESGRWSWAADYAGNSWAWTVSDLLADYGYMEFDLIGGSNYNVSLIEQGTTQTGTYMLDTDNHTIKITDAQLLCTSYYDGILSATSGEFRLITLNENAMQILVERAEDGQAICLNYVSEDYFNSWTPATDDNAAPELDDNWQDYVTQVTTTSMTWKLSADSPFDWCDLYGARKNSYASTSDYPTSYTPASDASEIELTLNSGTGQYSVSLPSGSVSGSFTLSSDGIYTFDSGLSSYLIGGDWVYFSADDDNELRVMSYTVSTAGVISDLWLGAKEYDASGTLYQYLAYHFELQTDGEQAAVYEMTLNDFNTSWSFLNSDTVYITSEGTYTVSVSGSDTDIYGIYLDITGLLGDHPNCDVTITDISVDGTSVTFDDSTIDRGTGDEATTARRYICNPWGTTAGDAANYYFTSSLSVTVQIEFETGVAFVTEE